MLQTDSRRQCCPSDGAETAFRRHARVRPRRPRGLAAVRTPGARRLYSARSPRRPGPPALRQPGQAARRGGGHTGAATGQPQAGATSANAARLSARRHGGGGLRTDLAAGRARHPAPWLPQYSRLVTAALARRRADPAPLLAGDDETGITIIQMNAGLDTGGM